MQKKRFDRKKLIIQRRVQRTKVKELENYLASMKAQAEQLNADIVGCEHTLAVEKEKLAILEREN